MIHEFISSPEMHAESEPLAQEVKLIIQHSSNPLYSYSVTESLFFPARVFYDPSEKAEFEQNTAAPYYSRYSEWKNNGHSPLDGNTRGLNAGQIPYMPDGRILFIGKTTHENPDKISSLDLVAGGSQQVKNISLGNTADREGSAEEAVEVTPDGNIVLPEGYRPRTLSALRENVTQFMSGNPDVPDRFLDPFRNLLSSENGDSCTTKPYSVDPSIQDVFSKLPTAQVEIRDWDGSIIDTADGYLVMHTNGGDLLKPRSVVNPLCLIDLEYDRPFVALTLGQIHDVYAGRPVQADIFHHGLQSNETIQVPFKPLGCAFASLLTE